MRDKYCGVVVVFVVINLDNIGKFCIECIVGIEVGRVCYVVSEDFNWDWGY